MQYPEWGVKVKDYEQILTVEAERNELRKICIGISKTILIFVFGYKHFYFMTMIVSVNNSITVSDETINNTIEILG